MKKLVSLEKNSFTLFETIVSITILAIVISGFVHSNTSNNNDILFQKLNEIENSFDTNDYSNHIKFNTKVTFIIDENIEEEILVKKYEFTNEYIKIYKYEK